MRNQIAAGEVVERPASVVKELVENALDAGATRIEIDLEEGGARLVRVRDDGSGMSVADLELCFAPHATSKLRTSDDLEHIASLGFRGEALASIGSVSRARITTRERGEPVGWRMDDEGGALSGPLEAGAAEGTSVEVRELFFNVPARRRFLKQPATELARCLDVVQRLALAHAGVAFVLTHEGKRVFDVEAGMDLRARVRRAFGAELAASLVPLEAEQAGLRLSGFVAPPRFARGDSSRQMFFLNGRFLRDKLLVRALKEGYRGFLFDSRSPVAFLELALDPARVDVNVHPQKSEVRFREERAIFGCVAHAVREAVKRCDMATPGAQLVDRALAREGFEPNRGLPFSSPEVLAAPARAEARAPLQVFERPGGLAALEPGGLLQVARTYIVRALPEGFEVIDQHALHERITYEALLRDLRAGRCERQRLLVPELVELSRADLVRIVAAREELARAGFELEPFGETTLALQAYPARLERLRAGELVRAIAAALEDGRTLGREQLLESVLQRAACRASVMAGDELELSEMRELLERGRALESDQTCVHGRPTRVRFTLTDLERAFLRTT
ncbi:MAG: DNA mismatch repair endonuclease MutL [Planctomycetes bacterium]|nr:DNA mismatch repair endonuclease MutL [Planctomycetota bacterium]